MGLISRVSSRTYRKMNFPIVPQTNHLFDETEVAHLKSTWLDLALKFFNQEPNLQSVQSYMQWSPRYTDELEQLIWDDDMQLILDLIHDKLFDYLYLSDKSPLKGSNKSVSIDLLLDLCTIFPIPLKTKQQFKFEKSKT